MASEELIDVKIDGKTVQVPNGTLIIRAAEKAGVIIPRFCDHPLLKPVAACRQCLVEVARPGRDGTVAKGPKPVPACAERVSPGTEVFTQHSSEVAKKAQYGVMEFLLLNHPLDCPICDKAGECPLQNQAITEGRTSSRFADVKRTYPKPVQVTPSILLDRDRCVLCQRCVRVGKEIAGDAFIQLQGRGGGTPGYEVHGLHGSQVGQFDAAVLDFREADGSKAEAPSNGYSDPFGNPGMAEGHNAGPVRADEMDMKGRPFTSYFSGNIVQVCPVGALTSADYRFKARPFDLVSVPGVAEHDASGSAIRIDVRHGEVVRRMAGEDPEVNEEWITDKDRWAFAWQKGPDRLTGALARNAEGEAEKVSYPVALEIAAEGLAKARENGGVAILTGGRLPIEDAYAYSRFARTVLGTNDIDFRTRPASAEEDAFLAAAVAGTGLGVTYSDLEDASHVLAVGLEAEEECGALFLRLRKAALNCGTQVTVMAATASPGTKKMNSRFIPVVPGAEASMLDRLAAGDPTFDGLADGGVILVGERAADMPGALSAALRLAERTGAALAWVPRRAGDRGALEAGAVGSLLPGGRPVAEAAARAEVAALWGVEELPAEPGRSAEEILAALESGKLGGVILAGIELSDLPAGAAKALEAAGFVLSLEVRATEAAKLADVVIPVAPTSEKGGTFLNWEGRLRPFGQVLTSTTLPDRKVLNDLAAEMGVDLELPTLAAAVSQIAGLLAYDGPRQAAPAVTAQAPQAAGAGKAVLASWKLMLGEGALLDFAENLAEGARAPFALLSEATAKANGIGNVVAVTGPTGQIVLPCLVDAQMPEGVVWIPSASKGCKISELGARAGETVAIAAATEVTK